MALVCLVFLFHLRSSLVVIISLPLGILAAFAGHACTGTERQHHVAGRHRHRHRRHGRCGHRDDRDRAQENGAARITTRKSHWSTVTEAAVEVGPPLFFSLLIITLSFLPVFTLQAQEGRLFAPLAFTKTYAMAAAAGLVDHPGAGADGLLHSRPNHAGTPEPGEPVADLDLPAADRTR